LNFKEKIKNLPSSSGVYLMKDSLQSIIYVGKSKNLKSRVSSYFVNSTSHSPKVVKLVKNVKDFEYILTDTEFEAFMLECKLIKEIKPIYNKKMKSPLSYTYIKIDKEKNMLVIDCILNLSKALKYKVIAEGVETEFQMNKLLSAGSNIIQGYYFSKPVSEEEVESILLNNKCS